MEISKDLVLKILGALVVLPIIAFIIYAIFNMGDDMPKKVAVETVSLSTFKEEFQKNDGRKVLDIRTLEEFNIGHLDGATNIDFYSEDFQSELEKLDRDSEYLLYCNSGNRSASALVMMKDLGFTNVKELSGGIQSWMGTGNEVCTDC